MSIARPNANIGRPDRLLTPTLANLSAFECNPSASIVGIAKNLYKKGTTEEHDKENEENTSNFPEETHDEFGLVGFDHIGVEINLGDPVNPHYGVCGEAASIACVGPNDEEINTHLPPRQGPEI